MRPSIFLQNPLLSSPDSSPKPHHQTPQDPTKIKITPLRLERPSSSRYKSPLSLSLGYSYYSGSPLLSSPPQLWWWPPLLLAAALSSCGLLLPLSALAFRLARFLGNPLASSSFCRLPPPPPPSPHRTARIRAPGDPASDGHGLALRHRGGHRRPRIGAGRWGPHAGGPRATLPPNPRAIKSLFLTAQAWARNRHVAVARGREKSKRRPAVGGGWWMGKKGPHLAP